FVVMSLINGAHASFTETLNNPVPARQHGTRHKVRGRSRALDRSEELLEHGGLVHANTRWRGRVRVRKSLCRCAIILVHQFRRGHGRTVKQRTTARACSVVEAAKGFAGRTNHGWPSGYQTSFWKRECKTGSGAETVCYTRQCTR